MTTLSNQQKSELHGIIKDVSNEMTKIDVIKASIKDMIKETADKYDLEKKILNKMVRSYHKQSFFQDQEEFSEFESLYEEVLSGS